MEISTSCPICQSKGNSLEVYPATIDPQSFTAEVFSARRLPDRRHYRWVKCKKCSLYRSDPISDIDLDELYKVSTFDYSTELHGLRNSYRKIVFKTCPSPKGKSIVEIGGGNGFFLLEAQEMGFTKLIEIEPSLSAFESAHKTLKPFFIVDMLRDGLVPDNSVDIVVIFHVLDHLPDPLLVLNQIHKMLKPGGSICIAVHNVNSVSAKILKNKSPIFDVEHTYLYSKKTIKKLLSQSGFKSIKVHHYKNSYSLAYLVHLIPINRNVKIKILNSKFGEKLRSIRITVPLGNMWAAGYK